MKTSILKRRTLTIAIALLLVFTMVFTFTACNENNTNSENASGTATTNSPALTSKPNSNNKDGGDDMPDWNGFDFGPNLEYAEEYEIEGDHGDYLPAWEAAKLTFDTMRDNGNISNYSDSSEYTMTLVDLTDIEGEECYVFTLDWDSDTEGAAYAYAYQSGNIYMQGQMGIWVMPVRKALNARISFITQEYLGDNIAEIPYIEYDENQNPAIDAINRSLNQGEQRIYEEFMDNKDEFEWIEIKSYPFTNQDYLQVVVTSCVYPNYGTDGDMFSINYGFNGDEWISVQDVMSSWLGMSQDDLLSQVRQLFVPEVASQSIGDVNAVGFLIRENAYEGHVQLLLEITVENSESEPWKRFYSFIPELNELFALNRECLFDPNEMDQMTPPLSYQKGTDAS